MGISHLHLQGNEAIWWFVNISFERLYQARQFPIAPTVEFRMPSGYARSPRPLSLMGTGVATRSADGMGIALPHGGAGDFPRKPLLSGMSTEQGGAFIGAICGMAVQRDIPEFVIACRSFSDNLVSPTLQEEKG